MDSLTTKQTNLTIDLQQKIAQIQEQIDLLEDQKQTLQLQKEAIETIDIARSEIATRLLNQ